jgi:hypothetical protein
MPSNRRNLLAAAGNGGDVLAEAVDFDGTNDYLSRASALTGNSDTQDFTCSFWVYLDSAKDTYAYICKKIGSANKFEIAISVAGSINLKGRNSGGTTVLDAYHSTRHIPLKTWTHVAVSLSLTNASNRYIYVNDVNVTSAYTWDVYSGTIDTSPAATIYHGVGKSDSADAIEGRLAHVFLDYTYRDLSIEANRLLFVDADGFPASGQADLSPILYLPMDDPDTVAVNAGTGGDMTLNGTIARSGRGPNQYNAVASTFDGANDYLSRSSLTGIA